MSVRAVRNAVALVCLFVAGLANGTMDALQFHFERTVFADASRYDPAFWNPAVSWKNKYRGGDPARGERFPLSTTALVAFTDAWHLSKLAMLKAFVLAVLLFQAYDTEDGRRSRRFVVAANAAAFVVLHLAFSAGFAVAYR